MSAVITCDAGGERLPSSLPGLVAVRVGDRELHFCARHGREVVAAVIAARASRSSVPDQARRLDLSDRRVPAPLKLLRRRP